jgi:hypothetical protein
MKVAPDLCVFVLQKLHDCFVAKFLGAHTVKDAVHF